MDDKISIKVVVASHTPIQLSYTIVYILVRKMVLYNTLQLVLHSSSLALQCVIATVNMYYTNQCIVMLCYALVLFWLIITIPKIYFSNTSELLVNHNYNKLNCLCQVLKN